MTKLGTGRFLNDRLRQKQAEDKDKTPDGSQDKPSGGLADDQAKPKKHARSLQQGDREGCEILQITLKITAILSNFN